MKIEKQIKELCKSTDIKVEEVNLSSNMVTVLLPYESASIAIDLEGDTPEEIIESFKENVNYRLERMIDHLNDCKL
ncbi:MAG: hypothetical protein ACQEXX_01355 [Bacillota bacterium]